MYCPRCGKQNTDISRYCVYCGTQVARPRTPSPAAPPSQHSAIGAPPPPGDDSIPYVQPLVPDEPVMATGKHAIGAPPPAAPPIPMAQAVPARRRRRMSRRLAVLLTLVVLLLGVGVWGIVHLTAESRRFNEAEQAFAEARYNHDVGAGSAVLTEYRKAAGSPQLRPVVIRHLVSQLVAEDREIRDIADRALGTIAPNWRQSQAIIEGVPDFIAALEVDDDYLKREAIALLKTARDRRAIKPLIALAAKTWRTYVGRNALQALDKIDPNWTKSTEANEAIGDLVRLPRRTDGTTWMLAKIDLQWQRSEARRCAKSSQPA